MTIQILNQKKEFIMAKIYGRNNKKLKECIYNEWNKKT
jgi:hypothetical protein